MEDLVPQRHTGSLRLVGRDVEVFWKLVHPHWFSISNTRSGVRGNWMGRICVPLGHVPKWWAHPLAESEQRAPELHLRDSKAAFVFSFFLFFSSSFLQGSTVAVSWLLERVLSSTGTNFSQGISCRQSVAVKLSGVGPPVRFPACPSCKNSKRKKRFWTGHQSPVNAFFTVFLSANLN